jgi:coatomer subunit delta
MVVLSAAVTNRSGKALISRQFVEMTRVRIEGLLAAFPKLVGSDGKQHTYIETESVRYLYQPIDNLFLLLITNRASNIVEDLETLRLLSKVVPDVIEVSNNISEERISEKCFDLIFAFDEVSYILPIHLPTPLLTCSAHSP